MKNNWMYKTIAIFIAYYCDLFFFFTICAIKHSYTCEFDKSLLQFLLYFWSVWAFDFLYNDIVIDLLLYRIAYITSTSFTFCHYIMQYILRLITAKRQPHIMQNQSRHRFFLWFLCHSVFYPSFFQSEWFFNLHQI